MRFFEATGRFEMPAVIGGLLDGLPLVRAVELLEAEEDPLVYPEAFVLVAEIACAAGETSTASARRPRDAAATSPRRRRAAAACLISTRASGPSVDAMLTSRFSSSSFSTTPRSARF